jgi:transcriptional regulator with XRE-family HTH domain
MEALLERLERVRKEKGLSLEKFAVQLLDVSFSTYFRWLKGNFNPDLKTFRKLEAWVDEQERGGSR